MAELTLRELVVNSCINELFFDGNLDGERAICWSRLSKDGATYILAASNGFDIWRSIFERQDLVTQYESSELDNLEIYLGVIKYAFDNSAVTLVKVGNKVILQCVGEKTTTTFDLYEAKINDKKLEMRYVIYHLTDKMKDLKKCLAEANEALEKEQRKEKDQMQAVGFGFEPVRKGGPSANLRRKQGTSLVNPNSKKAKRAKGISFE